MNNRTYNYELPKIDFPNLEKTIKYRICIEALHNMGLIPERIYHTDHGLNAEALDNEFHIWYDIRAIDRFISEFG